MRSLSDDLQVLARQPGTFRESWLKGIEARQELLSTVGSGRLAPRQTTLNSFKYQEICVIYSEILLQEDGAYELPPGWPESSVYGTNPEPAEELRPVIGDPYLIQRRVHAYGYRDESFNFSEQHLLAEFCQPFTGQGVYYVAIDPEALVWTPTFKSYHIVQSFDPDADQRIVDFILQMQGYYGAV